MRYPAASASGSSQGSIFSSAELRIAGGAASSQALAAIMMIWIKPWKGAWTFAVFKALRCPLSKYEGD